MSLLAWCHQIPCSQPSSTLTGTELSQATKSLASTLRSCPTLRPCGLWPASLLCQGVGVLQARTLEPVGQRWLPHPSRALCLLLPQPPAPLRTWCCLNPCDPSSCTASTPGLTGANPRPPGQPQEQTPVDDPHAEVEIKPQMKPRASVAEEEDPNPSHQQEQAAG